MLRLVSEEIMFLSHGKMIQVGVMLLSFGSLMAMTSSTYGQTILGRPKKCDPPPCPCPPTLDLAVPDPTKPPDPNQPSVIPSFANEQAVASVGETFAGAPNMIGDLLGAGNSVSFFYERSQGAVFIFGTGATSIINPKVSENNSPVPQDRVSFKYNYFANALHITGDSGTLVPAPDLGNRNTTVGQQLPRLRSLLTTQDYNEQDFTFSIEKTFWDRQASVELRIPFGRTLSRDLDLRAARITGSGPDSDGDTQNALITSPTPLDTLGSYGNELGNIDLIFKGLLYQDRTMAVSSGFSVNIPTARANHVKVTDFLGDDFDNSVEVQRQREFTVFNETWAISPFAAVIVQPTRRSFVQSFLQFDIPLNKSNILYSETPLVNKEPFEIQFDPLSASDSIREQSLMKFDLSYGFWLLNRPNATWLTGIAPTVELHYTTTLNNADIRTLPVAPKFALDTNFPNSQRPITALETPPQVGNLNNRLDILNLTLGSTFEIANRATIATGFVIPLKGGADRTFDFEFQLQLNWRFGPRSQFTRANEI
jgi:hypothetical protein